MPGSTNNALLIKNNFSPYKDASKEETNKEKVLNCFFRLESFADNRSEYKELSQLSVGAIVEEVNLPDSVVLATTLKFIAEASQFSQALSLGLTSWGSGEKSRLRQAKFYLRKAHKIAPVFDYFRAITNLGILHKLLKHCFYWPHITTQLALTIFITDRHDSEIVKGHYILQKNLRAFCACSAYAFHTSRNKLSIGKNARFNPGIAYKV